MPTVLKFLRLKSCPESVLNLEHDLAFTEQVLDMLEMQCLNELFISRLILLLLHGLGDASHVSSLEQLWCRLSHILSMLIFFCKHVSTTSTTFN